MKEVVDVKKYIKWSLLAVVAVVVLLSTTKVNITFSDNAVQADTITNLSIADANRYLEASIKNSNSQSVSTQQAQIANAIYSKEIYKLLKEKENK